MRITFLAFYFAFGVLTNLLILGPINWSSWPAWAVLLLWPAMWCAALFLVVFALWLIVILIIKALDMLGSIPFVQRLRVKMNRARVARYMKRVDAANAAAFRAFNAR